MQRDARNEAARWLAEAREDLRVCRTLTEAGHFSHACFHAQQSAEKAAKALLYRHGVEEAWGHSVADLLADAKSFQELPKDLLSRGARLDRYYIPTRYPNGLPGGLPSKAFDESDAREAEATAQHILQEIESYL